MAMETFCRCSVLSGGRQDIICNLFTCCNKRRDDAVRSGSQDLLLRGGFFSPGDKMERGVQFAGSEDDEQIFRIGIEEGKETGC